jgi:hypothetical protein
MDDAALYLEVDEDITSAIDKLGKTAGKTVSIVVPKRSTMLQSVINLKLLKKAASEQGKDLVLVTGDKVATDLAARVGLAVAPSLGAKAVMAAANAPEPAAGEDIIEEDDPEPPADAKAAAAAAGVAAGAVAAGAAAKAAPEAKPEPVFARREVNDPADEPTDEPAAGDAAAEASSGGIKGLKAPKVPNFNKLRRRGLWVGGAVAAILAYFIFMAFYSNAKVTLYATANKVNIDTTFSVDPSLKETQRDDGTKAHGTVTFKNCEDSNTYPLAGGNTIVSQGLSYTTDAPITIPAGTFSNGGKTCTSSTASVAVTATANGDKYNLTNASFTSGKLTANFVISGSMSGGTSKISTVVTQDDINKARDALLATDKDTAQKSIDGQAPSGYQALPSSLVQSSDNVVSAPALDQVGTTATLTMKATYTELAVKTTDYSEVIKAAEQKQVGAQNQIYDDGIKTATVTLSSKTPAGRQSFHFTTDAYGGAKLDIAQIKTQIKGKRYGDASDYLSKLPGVVRNDIALWPAWSSSLPGSPAKITITIQVAGTK